MKKLIFTILILFTFLTTTGMALAWHRHPYPHRTPPGIYISPPIIRIAPPVYYRWNPPPYYYFPPDYDQEYYRAWVPSHWEERWTPYGWERVWVPGHWEDY